HLYAVSRVENAIVTFTRGNDPLDPANIGRLTYVPGDTIFDHAGVENMGQPRAVTISPDGKDVYVAAATDSAVVMFRRDADPESPNFGELTFIQSYLEDVDGVSGIKGVRSVTVSPDGTGVYAAGEFDHSIVAFARNVGAGPDFGKLTFVEARTNGIGTDGINGIDQPYQVVTVNDSSSHALFIYVASPASSSVATFGRTVTSTCTASGVGNIQDK